jgi:hypothetical protein
MRATTANLDPAPGLAADVRRQSHRAHTRRVAANVALPVVACAATVTALVAGGVPTGTGPAPPGAVASTPPPAQTATVLAAPASYQLRNAADLPQCPDDAIAKVDAGVWFWTEAQTCILVVVDWADTKPGAAEPISVPGYPGLYGLTGNGKRTIYAPVAPNTNPVHKAGGWIVLTAPADVPPAEYVKLIVRSN